MSKCVAIRLVDKIDDLHEWCANCNEFKPVVI